MDGWIKLYRKFSEWEWFNISEMVHLFIYLLINANHENGVWRGINIKRGQILTGLNSLHQNTHITYQTLRTCLKRLEKTNEINIQVTNKYSIITICNYESYQGGRLVNNNQTNTQLTHNYQATNNQLTTNNNKENKENKEKEDKIKYAEFVLLKQSEYGKLISEHGNLNTNILIDILNNYKGSNGKKYKSDYLAILNWVVDRAKKDGKYEGRKLAI